MIAISSLKYAWGKTLLFDGLSAEVCAPGVVGLFGKNGSGKSSLLSLLSGLLRADEGTLSVNGFDPPLRQAEFLSSLYFLPEDFHLPDLSAREIVRSLAPFYPGFDHSHFDTCLQRLDVPQTTRFSRMSLGQRKKAAMAFALATMTPVLLMDEPTNGLDIVSRASFKRLLSGPEHAHRLVIISTHQAHDLESLMNRVWFIDSGQIVLNVPMQELVEQLEMGVAESAGGVPSERLIYQEAIGAHWAWVARRSPGAPAMQGAQIQIEMLYKALGHNKTGVLDALARSAA